MPTSGNRVRFHVILYLDATIKNWLSGIEPVSWKEGGGVWLVSFSSGLYLLVSLPSTSSTVCLGRQINLTRKTSFRLWRSCLEALLLNYRGAIYRQGRLYSCCSEAKNLSIIFSLLKKKGLKGHRIKTASFLIF